MELFNAMGIDKFGDGIPVSHLLTARGSFEDLVKWLQHLKEVVETATGSSWEPTFIVDMCDAEVNAIVHVFGDRYRHEKIIYCAWHVMRAWVKNSWCKIAADQHPDIPGIRSSVVGELMQLMYAAGDAALSEAEVKEESLRLFREFCSKWEAYAGVQPFIKYLETQYGTRISRWCHAISKKTLSGHATNNLLERYHGVIS